MIRKNSISINGMSLNEIEVNRRKYEKSAKIHFKKALVQQQKQAFDFVKSATSINQLYDFKPTLNHDAIKVAMVNVYQECGGAFAEKTYQKISQQTEKSLSQELYWQWMKRYAEEQTGNRITLITNTTEERFKQIVKDQAIIGEHEGYSIDKIAANIQRELNISNNYRAIRIARTEVVSASNAGSLAAASATNLPLQKSWLTAKTGNTRHSHKEMDGITIDMDKNFEVPIYDSHDNNIGSDLMQHPGDPNGSAGNVINCRCTIIYKRKI